MATIKMDVSEYEALKKVEALLEKALEKEEISNKEIIDLQEEKMKILEGNEKKVTTVTIIKKIEHKVSYHSIEEIVRRIQAQMSSDKRFGENSFDGMTELFDTFFQTKISEYQDSKIVKRVGLDEITATLKEEIRSEMSLETTTKLTKLIRLEEQESKWNKKLIESKEFGEIKNREANNLSKALVKSNEDIEELGVFKRRTDAIAKFLNETPTGIFYSSTKYRDNLAKIFNQFFKSTKYDTRQDG